MPKLCVVNGHVIGQTYSVEAPETVLGRSPEADLVLPDDKVSRQHCRITRTGSALEVEDLGSSNGTFVNGTLITRARLMDGDELRVGHHVFSVMLAPEPHESDAVQIVNGESDVKSTTVEVVVPEDTTDFLQSHLAEGQSPERMIRDLGVIYKVSYLINGQRDGDELLATILDLAFGAVDAERAYLALAEPDGRLLVKGRRFRNRNVRHRLSISRAIAELVLEKGQAVMLNDALHDRRFASSESVITHHLRSVLCVPLKCREKVLGLIFIDNPTVCGAFTTDDLRLVAGIAIQAGIAIENSRLFGALEELMFGSIGALVAAVEAKDHYIRGHSERVARISRAVGEEMSMPREVMKVVHLAALLHDIGKIGISETILNKEGHLTEAEMAIVREHPGRGAEILRNIREMGEISQAVRHHHEFYNGEGYPSGLAGKDIPVPSPHHQRRRRLRRHDL